MIYLTYECVVALSEDRRQARRSGSKLTSIDKRLFLVKGAIDASTPNFR